MRVAIIAFLALLVASMLVGAGYGHAEEEIAVSILSVDDTAFPEVTVVFTADQRGRPIGAIDPAELQIKESRLPSSLVSIRRAVDSDIPLALVVALDVSGSMEGATLPSAQGSATTLLESLGPADSALVLAFADEVRVEQTFTGDKAALAGAVSRLTAGGNTALYAAVAESARLAGASGLPRRAVVLLSDGEDFGEKSQLNREQSLALVSKGESLFYVIGVGPDIDGAYLEELATRSGGRFFQATSAAEVPAVYASLEELLRSQFVVTFRASSPADLQDRSVRISLTRGASTGIAERSYQSLRPPVPPPPPPAPVPVTAPVIPVIEEQEPSGSSSSVPLLVGVGALVALLMGLGIAWWSLRGRLARVPASEAQSPLRAPRAAPIAPSRAILAVVSGPNSGQSFEVREQPLTIGSGVGCAIRLPEAPGVASEHARVWWRDGRLMLHHIAAGQTTTVAGKVVVWTALEDGDEVSIGPYVLRCRGLETAQAREGRPPALDGAPAL